MRNLLVTGANRGLGLALTMEALKTGYRVFASCRNPAAASELHKLEAAHTGRLKVIRLDLCDSASHRAAREALEAAGEYVDILINNAGVYIRSPEVAPEASHQSIQEMLPESMRRMIEVNAVAQLAVTKELLPRIRRGQGAVIAFMSSGMGSLARKDGSELEYSYSASKAALNMLARCEDSIAGLQGLHR